ncbi:hypothetical protein FRB90_003383, partial [Tulasnella sp. 427]
MSALKRKERDPCTTCDDQQRPCDGLFPDCEYYRRTQNTSSDGTYKRRSSLEVNHLEQQVEDLERKLHSLTRANAGSDSRSVEEEVDWTVADPEDEIGIPEPFNRRPVEMNGRWWDRRIISPPVRNYLVRLAATMSSQYFSYFHLPTLFQSFEHPDPKKRPHPALLEAFYLTACFSTSFLPENSPYALSKHEAFFLLRARKAMEDSLAHCDRLLDYLKASNLVTGYLLMTGRYLEAFHQHAGASRLALACRLHKIKTHTYSPDVTSASEPGQQLIPPPTSQMELGDRILTFWSIYTRDKGASIITGFAPAIDDCNDGIITPLPRPLTEYENNDIRDIDMERLSDIFNQPKSGGQERRPESLFASHLKGLALIDRAIAVSSSPRTDGWERVKFAIQRLMDSLRRRYLSTNTNAPATEPPSLKVVTTVALGHTAALALNNHLGLTEPRVQQERVEHAKGITTIILRLPLEEAIKGCAVFGYSLGKAAEVLILHKKVSVARGLSPTQPELSEVEKYISRILEVIRNFTSTFPVLTFQVYHVQRLVDAALRAE